MLGPAVQTYQHLLRRTGLALGIMQVVALATMLWQVGICFLLLATEPGEVLYAGIVFLMALVAGIVAYLAGGYRKVLRELPPETTPIHLSRQRHELRLWSWTAAVLALWLVANVVFLGPMMLMAIMFWLYD